MKCPKCGATITAKMITCPVCGRSLASKNKNRNYPAPDDDDDYDYDEDDYDQYDNDDDDYDDDDTYDDYDDEEPKRGGSRVLVPVIIAAVLVVAVLVGVVVWLIQSQKKDDGRYIPPTVPQGQETDIVPTQPTTTAEETTAAPVEISGSVVTSGTNKYELKNGELKLTEYNEQTDVVRIPASIGGYPVTSIGGNAFAKAPAVQYLELPTSLKALDTYALQDISELKEIVMPESINSIGNYAFNKVDKAICRKGSYSWNYMRYVAADLVDGDALTIDQAQPQTQNNLPWTARPSSAQPQQVWTPPVQPTQPQPAQPQSVEPPTVPQAPIETQPQEQTQPQTDTTAAQETSAEDTTTAAEDTTGQEETEPSTDETTGEEDTTPQETTPEETSPAETPEETTVAEDTTQETAETTPEETTAEEDTTPQETTPEETTPEETTPEETTTEEDTSSQEEQTERNYDNVKTAIITASGGDIITDSYLFSDFSGDNNSEGLAVVTKDGSSSIWMNGADGSTRSALMLPVNAESGSAAMIPRGAGNNYGLTVYAGGQPYSGIYMTDGNNVWALIDMLQGNIVTNGDYVRIGSETIYASFRQEGDGYSEYLAQNISVDQMKNMPGGEEAWAKVVGIIGTETPPELYIQNRRTQYGDRLEVVYMDINGQYHTLFLNWTSDGISSPEYVDGRMQLSYTGLNKIYPNPVPVKEVETDPPAIDNPGGEGAEGGEANIEGGQEGAEPAGAEGAGNAGDPAGAGVPGGEQAMNQEPGAAPDFAGGDTQPQGEIPAEAGGPAEGGAPVSPEGNPPEGGAPAGPEGNPPEGGEPAGPEGNPPEGGEPAGPEGNPPEGGEPANPGGNTPAAPVQLTDAARSVSLSAGQNYEITADNAAPLVFAYNVEDTPEPENANRVLNLKLGAQEQTMDSSVTYEVTACDISSDDGALDVVVIGKNEEGRVNAFNIYRNEWPIAQLDWYSFYVEGIWIDDSPVFIRSVDFPTDENGQPKKEFTVRLGSPLWLNNLGPYTVEVKFECNADNTVHEIETEEYPGSSSYKLVDQTAEYRLAADTTLLTQPNAAAEPGAVLPADTRVYLTSLIKTKTEAGISYYVSLSDEAGNYGYVSLAGPVFAGIGQ